MLSTYVVKSNKIKLRNYKFRIGPRFLMLNKKASGLIFQTAGI